jgi:uncharacterized membrane protein YfhO
MTKRRSSTDRRQAPPKSAKQGGVAVFSALGWLFETHAAAILLAAIVFVVLIVFRDFLLLRNVYLYKDIASDSINGNWPQIAHTVDYLITDGFPKWTFSQGMGQVALGLYTFEPFLALFYLGGVERIPYLLGYVEALKIVLTGFFFFLYLKTLSRTNYTAIIGGILFSFSSYMILGSGWYFFSFDGLCIALLLYGFEKLLKEDVRYILPIPIALAAAYQPFQVYLHALFLFFYAVVRLSERGWNRRAALSCFLRVAFLYVLGLALSSLFLFSNIEQILQSPRVAGGAGYFDSLSSQDIFAFAPASQYASAVLRLFSNDLMGAGNRFKGWGNYLESPMFYCGLVTLLLVPQFFCFLDRRRRVLHGAMLGITAVSLIFPFVRSAAWLFSGDYFRTFSALVSLWLLYWGLGALGHIDRGKKVHSLVLILSLIVALTLLYLPDSEQYGIDRSLRLVVGLFLVAYTVLLACIPSKKYGQVARVGIFIVLLCEAAGLSNITVNRRDVLSSKELQSRVGYNDYTKDAIEFLKAQDKEFFRVEKDYNSGPSMHKSFNDAKMQHYWGTTSYHSFNQGSYVAFLRALEVILPNDEEGTRWIVGLYGRPTLQTLSGVKYYLTRRSQPSALGPMYEQIGVFEDVRVYRNRFSLPLGFCYDSYLTASRFSNLPQFHKDRAILKGVVIADDLEAQFSGLIPLNVSSPANESFLEGIEHDVLARRVETMSIESYGQNHVRGKVDIPAKRLLFFAIPYDQGWSARVDGNPTPLLRVNVGFMGLILEKGSHQVELQFQPPYLMAGVGVSLFSLVVYGFVLYRSRLRNASAPES